MSTEGKRISILVTDLAHANLKALSKKLGVSQQHITAATFELMTPDSRLLDELIPDIRSQLQAMRVRQEQRDAMLNKLADLDQETLERLLAQAK